MPETFFVLVDDGSTDDLTSKIKEFISYERLSNIEILIQKQNLGKAHALQAGFSYSVAKSVRLVGFLDADFSTSLEELNKLFKILESTDADAVIGSRQPSRNNNVEAELHRFLTGKIFSLYVRFYFKINIIDSQCGAKVFKVNNVLINSINQPIINPWLYDLQLLLPIIKSNGTIIETKLKKWINGSDSKLNFYSGLCAFYDLRKLKQQINHVGKKNI